MGRTPADGYGQTWRQGLKCCRREGADDDVLCLACIDPRPVVGPTARPFIRTPATGGRALQEGVVERPVDSLTRRHFTGLLQNTDLLADL